MFSILFSYLTHSIANLVHSIVDLASVNTAAPLPPYDGQPLMSSFTSLIRRYGGGDIPGVGNDNDWLGNCCAGSWPLLLWWVETDM